MRDLSGYSKARYDAWLSAILVGSLLAPPVIGAVLFGTGDAMGGGILMAVTVFNTLIFWCVLPRGCEIWADRLRVVFGWPFTLNVPFDTVAEIRPARIIDAMFCRGFRVAMSIKTPVEIRRSKGMNIVISPHNRQEFIEKAHQALSRYQRQLDTED
ncbi:MAG: PH domain-containing protein [Dehalococcoidia bacterium]|nr:PH domain-containing protein [Dehalococcoidia bacterium]